MRITTKNRRFFHVWKLLVIRCRAGKMSASPSHLCQVRSQLGEPAPWRETRYFRRIELTPLSGPVSRGRWPSRCRRSRPGRILRFESLEDRRVLTTFTVTNLNDATVTGPGNAPGTLRQAIYDANAFERCRHHRLCARLSPAISSSRLPMTPRSVSRHYSSHRRSQFKATPRASRSNETLPLPRCACSASQSAATSPWIPSM